MSIASAKVMQKQSAIVLHFFELCLVVGPPILTLKRRQLADLDNKEEYHEKELSERAGIGGRASRPHLLGNGVHQ
jgi:hypothetical protein